MFCYLQTLTYVLLGFEIKKGDLQAVISQTFIAYYQANWRTDSRDFRIWSQESNFSTHLQYARSLLLKCLQVDILGNYYHSHDTPQFLVTDYQDLMDSSRKYDHENPRNPPSILYIRVQELLYLGFIFVPGQNTDAVTTQPSLRR